MFEHSFIKLLEDCAYINLWVTPNSSIDKIEGDMTRDDNNKYLKLKTRAIPEDNKANLAIIKMIAKALGVSKSNITIHSGAISRNKVLLVEYNFSSIDDMIKKLY